MGVPVSVVGLISTFGSNMREDPNDPLNYRSTVYHKVWEGVFNKLEAVRMLEEPVRTLKWDDIQLPSDRFFDRYFAPMYDEPR